MHTRLQSCTAILVAGAMCVSTSTAASASVPVTALAVAANCAASIGAAGAAVQAPVRPGCVLPAVDAPAPAPIMQSPPMVRTEGRRFNLWPILGGLAAIIAAVVLLSSGDDDNDDDGLSRG